MDKEHILGSLDRITSALGVSWSNNIIALSNAQGDSAERAAVAVLIGVVVASWRTRGHIEGIMRSSVFHLWMVVILNAAFAAARVKFSSFIEQLLWSAVILFAAESIHAVTALQSGAHSFVVSAKYLFAESLATEYESAHEHNPLVAACIVVLMYKAAQMFVRSAAVRGGVALMAFDTLGNIALAAPVFPINKITLALALALTCRENNEVTMHLREYSRWEGAQELLRIGKGHEYDLLLLGFLAIIFTSQLNTAKTLREAVHDMALLTFFELFFKEATSFIAHVFANNVFVAFIFSLFTLALCRAAVTPQK